MSRMSSSFVARASSSSALVMYPCWNMLLSTRLRRSVAFLGLSAGSYFVGAFVMPAIVAASVMLRSFADLLK